MTRRRSDTGGFTLIEVLVAIVILGITSVGLAGLMLTSARGSRDAGAIGYRTAVLNAEVSRIAAIPQGSLSDGTTSRTVTSQPFPYTMSTVVATASGTQTVTITITPTGGRAISGISRTITRNAKPATNPFSP